MTAQEIAREHYNMDSDEEGHEVWYEWNLIEAMKEYAQQHVKLALEAAYENAETIEYDNDMGEFTAVIDPGSVLNSYPLENIK